MLSGSETEATSFGVAAPAPAAPNSAAVSAAIPAAASMRVRFILLLSFRERSDPRCESSQGLLELVLVIEEVVVRRPARHGALDEVDSDLLDPVAVHLEHVEAHPVPRDVVAWLWRTSELPEDEAGDRMEVLVRQLGAEALVELV